MKFELTVLGTSAAVPTLCRGLSAQVLNVGQQLYAIDCGEGTQLQMLRFGIRRNRIHQIFISHLHGDHCFGLIGLLTSYALAGRKVPIDIFSPVGLEEMILTQFRCSGYVSPFAIRFHIIDPTQAIQIFEDKYVTVSTIPLKHRIPTCGYLFREKPAPRNIRTEKISELQLTFNDIRAIKNGADYISPEGICFPNAVLTHVPAAPRSFAYCSDTAFHLPIVEQIKGVDLLYHEATFRHDMLAHADISGHSTAPQAAEIAAAAQVRQLLIGHFSTRYDSLDALHAEATAIFLNTLLATDGLTIAVEYTKEV